MKQDETQGLSETNPHFPNIPMDTNNDNGPDSGKSRKELDVTLAHEDSPEQVYLRQGESESANRASAAAKVMDTTDGNDTDSRKQGKQLDVTPLTEKPKTLLNGWEIIDKTRRELGVLEITSVCDNGMQTPHYHVIGKGDFKGTVNFEDAEEYTEELIYIYKDKDGKDIYIDSWVDSPRGMDKVKHLYISCENLPCIAGVVSGAHLCSDVKVVERCVPHVTVNPFSEKEGNSPEQSAGPSTSVAESCKEAIVSFAANNKIDLPTAISMVSTLTQERKISFFSAEVREIPQGMDVGVGDIVAVSRIKLTTGGGVLSDPETYRVEVTSIDYDLRQYSGIARRNTESVDVIFCRNDIAGYYPPLTEQPPPPTYQGPLRWINRSATKNELEEKIQKFVNEYLNKAYPPSYWGRKAGTIGGPQAPDNEPTFPFFSEKQEAILKTSADLTESQLKRHEEMQKWKDEPEIPEQSAANVVITDVNHLSEAPEEFWPQTSAAHLKFKDDLNTILSETETLLTEKNLAYRDSSLSPVGIFQKNVSVKYGLGVRIDDKLSHIMRRNSYPGNNDIDDLIGYLVLLKIAIRREEQADGQ